jgi:hypothetical protein
MPELDDAALELRLRGVLKEHLGALPLDLTVEALDRRREAMGPARRFGRGRGITLLAAAALLLVGGTLAAGSGVLRLPSMVPPVPAPSSAVPVTAPAPTWRAQSAPACWEAASTVDIASEGTVSLSGTTVTLDYALPAELGLDTASANGAVGFGTPQGLPDSFLMGHGVIVADVSDAVRHGSLVEQPRLGTDAETFLRDLDRAFRYQDGTIDFHVDDIAPTEIAKMPAWSATISVPDDAAMWSHIDTLGGGRRACAAEFGMANRVWVMDVGPSVVLVQAWAPDDLALDAWLPDATRLVDALRFRSDAP